jgi:hypothetical protein
MDVRSVFIGWLSCGVICLYLDHRGKASDLPKGLAANPLKIQAHYATTALFRGRMVGSAMAFDSRWAANFENRNHRNNPAPSCWISAQLRLEERVLGWMPSRMQIRKLPSSLTRTSFPSKLT